MELYASCKNSSPIPRALPDGGSGSEGTLCTLCAEPTVNVLLSRHDEPPLLIASDSESEGVLDDDISDISAVWPISSP